MVDNVTSSAPQGLAESTWEPYRAFMSSLVAAQEQNTKLARRSMGAFLEGVEKQQEVLQGLVEESFKAYTGLFYAPVSSPRNGLHANGNGHELPVEDYDQLTAKEVIDNLAELSAEEVEEIKEHERKYKNRATLIERFDRSLV